MPDSLSRAFKYAAFAEAVSWFALLIGMVLKHVTKTTDLGVQIVGPIHGVLFVTYTIIALRLWQGRPWANKTFALAVVSAVVPMMTIWFERKVEHDGDLGPRPRTV